MSDVQYMLREILAKSPAAGHDTAEASTEQLLRGLLRGMGIDDADAEGVADVIARAVVDDDITGNAFTDTEFERLRVAAEGALHTQEFLRPKYEDVDHEVARVRAPRIGVDTGNYTTTDSYALIDDGVDSAQILLTEQSADQTDDVSFTVISAIVENTGGTNNADAKMQARYNDGTTQSAWADVPGSEETSIALNGVTVLESTVGADALYDEYRIVAKSTSAGNSTTVQGFLTAKGS